MTDEIKKIGEIDWGNYDWYVGKDKHGNYWVRPSLKWNDGEVYESFTSGKALYKKWLAEME